MYGALLSGDVVLVNKLALGARLPIDALSTLRMPGFRAVQRNDILCFNYPSDGTHGVSNKTVVIKRCIALPGDTIQIIASEILINNAPAAEVETLGGRYHVRTKEDDPAAFFERAGVILDGKISNQNDWIVTTTAAAGEKLKSHEEVLFVQKWDKPAPADEVFIYPFSDEYPWSTDNFGPLYVPKQGDTLTITAENLPLYRAIIEKFEGHQIKEDEKGQVLIDGKYANGYVVGRNYYFVLGDNRYDSSDSRFWGFLPESHIIGCINTVLFSYRQSNNSSGGIRWGRTLKGMN